MDHARLSAGRVTIHPPPAKGGALVVDADRRRRVLYARVLRNAGYDVRFAVQADEAVTADPGAFLTEVGRRLQAISMPRSA